MSMGRLSEEVYSYKGVSYVKYLPNPSTSLCLCDHPSEDGELTCVFFENSRVSCTKIFKKLGVDCFDDSFFISKEKADELAAINSVNREPDCE